MAAQAALAVAALLIFLSPACASRNLSFTVYSACRLADIYFSSRRSADLSAAHPEVKTRQ